MRRLLFLLLFFGCSTTPTSYQSGRVVAISDGDTFTMLMAGNLQVKVRLYGIDCPEKAQEFGSVARQKLSSLAFGQTVRVEQKDVDRYGRTVAIVFNANGINVNEELLRSGLAWHYTQYDKSPAWDTLEQQARHRQLGLWAQPYPTPPWLWRKAKREAVP